MLTKLTIAVILLSTNLYAASFDCAKPGTKVEHMICDDIELSRIDEQLAKSYKGLMQDITQTEQIQQSQKLWMKERNGCTDMVCVKDAYRKRIGQLRISDNTPTQEAAHEVMETPDKPGYFRLDQSNDDEVCHSLGSIINADIKKYGETHFDEHDEFVMWRDVDEEEIDRGKERRYGGKIEQADVDINNDRVVDRVIRSKWAMASVELDALHVRPQTESKKIDADELLRDDTKNISFIGSKYWLDRYHKKYGDPTLRYQKGYSGPGWDWYFGTGVSIELVRMHGATYLVAQEFAALPKAIAGNIILKDYVAPPDASARIFVFQLDKEYRKYEEKDVCMFVRTCPCGGCKNVRGTTEESRTLPGKKWCKK